MACMHDQAMRTTKMNCPKAYCDITRPIGSAPDARVRTSTKTNPASVRIPTLRRAVGIPVRMAAATAPAIAPAVICGWNCSPDTNRASSVPNSVAIAPHSAPKNRHR